MTLFDCINSFFINKNNEKTLTLYQDEKYRIEYLYAANAIRVYLASTNVPVLSLISDRDDRGYGEQYCMVTKDDNSPYNKIEFGFFHKLKPRTDNKVRYRMRTNNGDRGGFINWNVKTYIVDDATSEECLFQASTIHEVPEEFILKASSTYNKIQDYKIPYSLRMFGSLEVLNYLLDTDTQENYVP